MSSLEDLCRTLEAVNRDAETFAAELLHQSQIMARFANLAANLGTGSNRIEGAITAQALQAASRSTQQAAQLLHQAALEGRGFVSRHSGADTSPTAFDSDPPIHQPRHDDGQNIHPSQDETGSVHPTIDDVLHGAEDPRLFRLKRPDEYLEPMGPAHNVERFRDPREFVHRINPDFETGRAYQVNCADCARCFEAAWRGREQQAAGRSYQIDPTDGLKTRGEASIVTEEWARERFAMTNAKSLQSTLERGGHGSSAIVHSAWSGKKPGAHAYNVVNFHGEILIVDSQEEEIYWYAEEIYPGMEYLSGVIHTTMAWDAQGKRIPIP